MQNVTVPQQEGEIRISHAGDEPVVYPVKNGTVQVEDAALDGFLRQVPGAEIAAGNPSKEA